MESEHSTALSLLLDATTKPQPPVQMVVTVGTWVEYVLYQILRQYLKFPDELGKKDKDVGIGYAALVRLIVALGALPSDLKRVLEHFGSIRNRFAHDIRTVFTRKDLDQFLDCFPCGLRAVLDERIASVSEFQWSLLILGEELYRCMDDPESPTDSSPFVPEDRESFFATFLSMMHETEGLQAVLRPVR